MKKNKLLSLVFAFALIIPCLFLLSACDDKKSANIYGLYTKIDGVENYYLGEFDYGQIIDFSNVKVFARYSDETEKDITIEENLVVTYSYNAGEDKPFSEMGAYLDVGDYSIIFKYDRFTATLGFSVQPIEYNVGYRISLGTNVWNYDQTPASVTLDICPEGASISQSYYLTEEEYQSYSLLENEDQQKTFLYENFHSFPTDIYDIHPGKYHAFAEISDSTNYKGGYSNLVNFKVNPGNLTKTETARCTARTYIFDGEVGKTTLSKIPLLYSDSVDQFKDSTGQIVNGTYKWKYPETQVDFSNSGNKYPVVFVPTLDNLWNNCNYGLVSISIEKGTVQIPSDTYIENSEYYKDMSRLGLFSFSGPAAGEIFLNLVKITKSVNNGAFEECNTIEFNENSWIVDTAVNDIGKYQYKLSLTDKTNYYWETTDFSTDDLIYTFNVNKIPSYIGEVYEDYRYIDAQGKVIVEIDTSATSYQKGTMQATKLDYLYNCTPETQSNLNCDLEIIEENEKTYLIISVENIIYNEIYGSKYGQTGIRITANGTNNYEDIDYSFNIDVYKHDASEFLKETRTNFDTANNISETSNKYIYKPVGTKISDIFTNLPTNDFGKIILEVSIDGGNTWREVTDSDKVTEIGLIKARFSFVSNNEEFCESEESGLSNDYYVKSDYAQSKQTLTKESPINYTSANQSGIWLFVDLSDETSGNQGYTITLTASNTSSNEIPQLFNVYTSSYDDFIYLNTEPSATLKDFASTANSDEYSLNFNTVAKFIYIYIEFAENVDVNISYSVASYGN